MNTLWEYKTIRLDLNTIDEINKLGRLGWELVAIDHPFAYFKRPLNRFGGHVEFKDAPS